MICYVTKENNTGLNIIVVIVLTGIMAPEEGMVGITVPDPREKYGKITTDEVIYLRKRYVECKYPASYI